MEITEIAPQKNKKFFNIFVDGEFVCSVNDEMIYYHDLKVGKEIGRKHLLELKKESDLKKAFNQALKYTSYSMRTENEIWMYLEKKDYPSECIVTTIAKLKEYKFIDDGAYVENYIKSKAGQGDSRNKVRYSLLKKGISEDVILEAIDRYFPHHTEIEHLEAHIMRIESKYKMLPYRDKLIKIQQHLTRKGYDIEDISTLLDKNISRETTEHREYANRLRSITEKYVKKYQNKDISLKEVRFKTTQALYRRGYEMQEIKEAIDILLE